MAFNKAKAFEEAAKLVSQRRLSQAIKQYLAIAEQDPQDLSLLNTIGDLCVRDGNISEALRQFSRLAEAYAREGSVLKAIAIYKKVVKLDPRSIDPLIELGELYAGQGLGHEAREQYAHALARCQQSSLPDKALQIIDRLVAQEPQNAAYRLRLAEHCELAGRATEACHSYLEAARLAHRHKNTPLAGAALKKASELNPRHPQVLLLQAHLAAENKEYNEVERILAASPESRSNPEARALLLSAYLEGQKLDEAARLAVESYHADPAGFEVVSRFCVYCIEAGNPDAALEPLGTIVDRALERKQAGPVMELLHRILAARPVHNSSLELIGAICLRAGTVEHSGETLAALASAFAETGQWTKAERIYRQLLEGDKENLVLQSLLKQAMEAQRLEQAPSRDSEPTSTLEADPLAPPEEEMARDGLWTAVTAPSAVADPPSLTMEIDLTTEWGTFAASSATDSGVVESAVTAPPDADNGLLRDIMPDIIGDATPAPPETTASMDVSPGVAQLIPDPSILCAASDLGEEKTGIANTALPELPLLTELGVHLEEILPEQESELSTAEPGVDSAQTAGALSLSFEDLLAELESDQGWDHPQESPQAHYDLGVAFREMGLLEEAIGELQKVAKGAGHSNFPARYLEACSLLGACFMEKRMPAIAAKWYSRALQMPDLSEEARLALSYDLAVAYEQSGDLNAAVEKFSEVYSLDVDYRDVAKKIHTSQRKSG